MLNAGGALLSSAVDGLDEDSAAGRRTVTVTIRGSGRFLAFSSRSPTLVKVGGVPVDFAYAAADKMCTFDIPRPEEDTPINVAVTL